ncbi:MAG: NTP transferase domain-containing protein, partial [Candidatus Cloacimonetes bacterium]|nr:NTP transferase domain-containing protein [Candidatus Cloacimonadota bacterium]
MIALIMAGGIGTRFWPLSTRKNPKQFLNILGNRSMIQQTVDRISPKISSENIYVVTNQEQIKLVE